MRLIDADKLEDAVYNEAFKKDGELKWDDAGYWIPYRMFLSVLDSMPTMKIEIKEVKEKKNDNGL